MAGATNAENRNDRVLKGRYLPIRTFPSKPHLLKRPGDLCACLRMYPVHDPEHPGCKGFVP